MKDKQVFQFDSSDVMLRIIAGCKYKPPSNLQPRQQQLRLQGIKLRVMCLILLCAICRVYIISRQKYSWLAIFDCIECPLIFLRRCDFSSIALAVNLILSSSELFQNVHSLSAMILVVLRWPLIIFQSSEKIQKKLIFVL